MVDKKYLLEKIDKESKLWLDYYINVDMYLYAIAGACFRAKAVHTNKEVIAPKNSILDVINNDFNTIEDDEECLNTIYSLIMNSNEDVRNFITQELSNIPEATEKGIDISEMKIYDALEEIENQLIARKNIENEASIRLQTLQWVKDIIEEDKKEA